MKYFNFSLILIATLLLSSCNTMRSGTIRYAKVDQSDKMVSNELKKSLTGNSIALSRPTHVNINNKKDRLELPFPASNTIIYDQPNCDTIILKSGEIISCEVIVAGREKIRYKKCGESKGGESSILTSQMKQLKYSNGTALVYNEDGTLKEAIRANQINEPIEKVTESPTEAKTLTKKNEKASKRYKDYTDDLSLDNSRAHNLVTFSIFSFVPAIGFFFSIFTFIRARKELLKIEQEPEKYSGKRKILLAHTLATISLTIGMVLVVATAIFFLLLFII